MVPLKYYYVQKLIFLHGLKHWVHKIIYKRIDILETCQRSMKMVECMEDEAPACPKGEIKSGVSQKKQANPSSGSKGRNKCKWGQGKPRPPNNKEKLVSKKPPIKKVKWDLSKVKCFNCDNKIWQRIAPSHFK
jgi:hypothetical protein